MKVREKNPVTKELVVKLRDKSLESQRSFWKAVAKGLNRPRRKQYEVNLVRLEKYANPKETVIVPGTVLGSGEIKKKLTVAALKFSGRAMEKIEKAGGKCISLEELIEKDPKGKNIMIMG